MRRIFFYLMSTNYVPRPDAPPCMYSVVCMPFSLSHFYAMVVRNVVIRLLRPSGLRRLHDNFYSCCIARSSARPVPRSPSALAVHTVCVCIVCIMEEIGVGWNLATSYLLRKILQFLSLLCTRWPIWSRTSFCWHWNNSCALVQEVYIAAELLIWCQPTAFRDQMAHPVLWLNSGGDLARIGRRKVFMYRT